MAQKEIFCTMGEYPYFDIIYSYIFSKNNILEGWNNVNNMTSKIRIYPKPDIAGTLDT